VASEEVAALVSNGQLAAILNRADENTLCPEKCFVAT
jgi:hypothetical protein